MKAQIAIAQKLSFRFNRAVWVFASPNGHIRFHLATRKSMGDLLFEVCGSDVIF